MESNKYSISAFKKKQIKNLPSMNIDLKINELVKDKKKHQLKTDETSDESL